LTGRGSRQGSWENGTKEIASLSGASFILSGAFATEGSDHACVYMDTEGPWKEGVMKSNKIHVLLIEESGSGSSGVSLSNNAFSVFCLFSIVSVVFLSWLLCDYLTLKPRAADVTEAEQISFHQGKQIAYLTKRIEGIHKKLEQLDEYDLRLRNVAHISTGDKGGSLVGVGGSDPGGIDDGMRKKDLKMIGSGRGHGDRHSSAESTKKQQGFPEFTQAGSLLARTAPTQWPAKGWVCSKFGACSGHLNGEQKFHRGVDIATRENAPVLAPADGLITSVDWREGYGKRVVLAHGSGLVSVFSHLDKVLVAKGEPLRQGDVVATAGGTGRSTGPYVHYEVHFYGVPVDPQQFLQSFPN